MTALRNKILSITMIVMESITIFIRFGFSRKHQATHVCQHNGRTCCFIGERDLCCVANRWLQQSCGHQWQN
ncbi:hypothetical protein IBT54_003646 [Pantoea sp. S62]|nr:hypothetical protein [Pantoea sp. S62]